MSIYRWVWHLIPSQPQLPIPNYGLADDVAIIQHQTGVLRSSNMTSSHDKLFCCRIVWGSNRSLPQIFTPANIRQAHFHVFFPSWAYRGDQCGYGCVRREESNLTNSRHTINNCVDFFCSSIELHMIHEPSSLPGWAFKKEKNKYPRIGNSQDKIPN